jgi:hypothetical protein
MFGAGAATAAEPAAPEPDQNAEPEPDTGGDDFGGDAGGFGDGGGFDFGGDF